MPCQVGQRYYDGQPDDPKTSREPARRRTGLADKDAHVVAEDGHLAVQKVRGELAATRNLSKLLNEGVRLIWPPRRCASSAHLCVSVTSALKLRDRRTQRTARQAWKLVPQATITMRRQRRMDEMYSLRPPSVTVCVSKLMRPRIVFTTDSACSKISFCMKCLYEPAARPTTHCTHTVTM